MTVGFGCGIALSGGLWMPWGIGIGLLAIGATAVLRRRAVSLAPAVVPVLVLVALAGSAAQLGAWRAHAVEAGADQANARVQAVAGQQQIRGLVEDDPTPRARTTSLTLDHVLIRQGDDWLPLGTHVLVSVPSGDHEYGEYLQLRGKLQPLGGSSGAVEALHRQGVLASMSYPQVSYLANPDANPVKQGIFRFRHRLGDAIDATLPDPTASTLKATLLGLRSILPKAEQQALVDTGTVHLIVISGFKLSVLAGGLEVIAGWLLRRFGRGRIARWLVALAVIGAIAGYTIMTGATPSAVRAALMAGVVVLAGLAGRQRDQLTSLALAVLVILAINPDELYDPGFQLSCLSVLGITLLAEPLTRLLAGGTEQAWRIVAAEATAASAAATAFDVPVLAGSFHTLSLISPLANLLGMPLLGPIMLFGGVGSMLGALVQPLGVAPLWIGWGLTQVLEAVVHLGAAVPFAALPVGEMPAVAVVAYYAVLLGVVWLLLRRPTVGAAPHVRVDRRVALGVLAAAVAAVAGVSFLASRPPERVRITMLDVEGAGALIQSPGGVRVLVDGGSSAASLQRELGRLLPPWDRHIDLLIVTSPRSDHIAALPDTLDRYNVAAVAAPDVDRPTITYSRLLKSAQRVQPGAVELGGVRLSPAGGSAWRIASDGVSVMFDDDTGSGQATASDVVFSLNQPAISRLWVRPNIRGGSASDDAVDLAKVGSLTIDL